MRLSGVILILFIFSSEFISGQNSSCHRSTEGKDFWFGFMEGRTADYYNPYVEITLSSGYSCKYKIFIGKATVPSDSGIVNPNIPLKVRLDWRIVEAMGSEVIQERAIHLVSDNPLNVYALNYAMNSSEVATVFPTESIGSEYYAMCYDPHVSIQYNVIVNLVHYPMNIQGKNSEFLIVASHDSTIVTITPSVVTDGLRHAHVPFTVRLNKGELYQVQSANLPNLLGQGDLTGSYISSNYPIALFSGSYATTIPNSSDKAYDHLYEQMPPLQTWGRKFITVPLMSRHEDTYRILAAEDNTTVKVGSLKTFVLNHGQFHEFMLGYNQPSLVESDKPILLAQFSNSNSVDSLYTHGNGDPFMVIVSPVNQTRQKVAFVAYDSPAITTEFFINVIIKDDVIGNILLDKTLVDFNAVSGTGYSFAQVSLKKGSHFIECLDPAKGFIAYVYGFGAYEGYGYGVGYNLDIVLDVGGKLNAGGGKSLLHCYGAPPQTLDAGNSFTSYLWNTGETTSSIQASKGGWYKVTASTSDGCNLSDSVELKVDRPILNLGTDTTICKPNKIALKAPGNFSDYIWSTKETASEISVSKTDSYSLNVVDSLGCKTSDTIKISFVDKPKMNLSRIDTLLCGIKSATLDVSADKGNFTFQRLDGNFTFNNPQVSVPDFGSYLFDVKVTDQYSCYSDSVVKISFRDKPSVDLLIDSTLCFQFDPLVKYQGNTVVAASDFIWIYQGDTIRHGIGIDTVRIPIGIKQTVSDLKLIVSQLGCSNSKVISGIKTIPKLKMVVVDSTGCVPYTAKFLALNEGGVSYEWDFGDGIKLISSASDPSHTYLLAGSYPVKVKVTTNKGCINEFTKDSSVQVNPIPVAAFAPFSSECLNKGKNEITGLDSGNPSDQYIWDLSKLDLAEIIQNPGDTKGPLVFDLKNKPQASIGLMILSKYKCPSTPVSALIKRKPDFSMYSTTNQGCSPLASSFLATVTDPVDQLIYHWDFGDGGSGSNNEVSHIYDQADHKYDIRLNGISSLTGCSDTIGAKDFVWVYPKPKALFTVDNPIVYNDKPTVHFLNSSTGGTHFSWDFGDGGSSDQKDPAYDFLSTGYHKVLLEAFNTFDCSDTTSNTVLVAFSQLFPPNGFSPNAPDPIDREYKLAAAGIPSDGYHMRIYSRWEDLIFETLNEIKGWDGRFKNGSFAPPGVYVWVLDFKDFLGRKHRQTGTVTLVF